MNDRDDYLRNHFLSRDEDDLLRQYRLLDSTGKEIVRFIIEKELDRLKKLGMVSDDEPDSGNTPTITFTELYKTPINHP